MFFFFRKKFCLVREFCRVASEAAVLLCNRHRDPLDCRMYRVFPLFQPMWISKGGYDEPGQFSVHSGVLFSELTVLWATFQSNCLY